MAYDASTLKQIGAQNTTPNGGLEGIWQSGAAPAGDSSFLYFATGNGTLDVNKGGVDYGDSIMKLAQPSGGTIPVVDSFAPTTRRPSAALTPISAPAGLCCSLIRPGHTRIGSRRLARKVRSIGSTAT
jgi:hypothetical protein